MRDPNECRCKSGNKRCQNCSSLALFVPSYRMSRVNARWISGTLTSFGKRRKFNFPPDMCKDEDKKETDPGESTILTILINS
jgi:ribosomal protein S2